LAGTHDSDLIKHCRRDWWRYGVIMLKVFCRLTHTV